MQVPCFNPIQPPDENEDASLFKSMFVKATEQRVKEYQDRTAVYKNLVQLRI